MTWRVTGDAERDLDHLVTFGARQYGMPDALKYYDDLVDVFEQLSAHPRIVRVRRTRRHDVRLFPCRAHNILYLVENNDVVILRVPHHTANWIDHL